MVDLFIHVQILLLCLSCFVSVSGLCFDMVN